MVPVDIPGVSLGTELGLGVSAVVYRAERQGRCYAVKVSRGVPPPEVIRSFQREATVLACLRHPNIARVFAAGEADGRPYLVLELVEGQSLADRLAAGPAGPGPSPGRGLAGSGLSPLTVPAILRIGQDVAGALAAAHRLGLVHQDVKPANIMIGSGGRVILVDFGLLGRTGGVVRDEAVGTVLYSAPEQLGMLNRPVDARSDLYSLGVVLHTCLTGRPPFEADDVAELMRLHAVAPPPDPSRVRDDIPPALAEAVATLLAKDPDDRFQSADDLAAALAAVAGPRAPAVAARAGPWRPSDQPVGREAPLARLREAWDLTRRGAGERTVVGIAGDMGVGKTHLVRTFVRQARSVAGAVLMEAKCAERVDAPFVTFHALVESWLHAPAAAPAAPAAGETPSAAAGAGRRSQLRAAAGADAPVLAGLHPALGAPGPPRENQPGPATGLHQSASVTAGDLGVQLRLAVVRFVRELARRSGGLLLWVDDTQWLGAADRQLLEEVANDPEPAPLLVIATSRRADRLLPAGRSRRVDLRLGPLGAPEVAELIRGCLGDVADERFVRDVAIRSGGCPLAVFELVRAVIDAGLIRPSWDGFDVDRDGLDSLALPDEVLGLIRRRVGALDRSSLPVLCTAAAIGHQFDRALLAVAAGVTPEHARLALAEAEFHQLVTPVSDGCAPDRWSFVHDCVREALLSTISADGLRARHAAIADAMEASGAVHGPDLFALARHAVSGGLPAPRLYRLTRAAAEAAVAGRAPVEAERLFRAAAQAAARADIGLDAAFETGFGLACSRIVQPHRARAHFARALELENDPLARAALRAEAAGIEHGMRNYSAAANHVRRGLAEAGRPIPGPVLVGPVAFGRMLCALAMRWPATGFGTATGAARRRYETELRLHEIGGVNALFLFDIPTFLWHVGGLYVMKRVGFGELFIRGNIIINCAAAELGCGRTTRRAIRTFRALAEQTGNPALVAEADLYSCFALQFLGETTTVSDQLEATLRRAARWVDASLYDDAVTALAMNYSYRGLWREGLACLQPNAYGIDYVFNDIRIMRSRMARSLGGAGENLEPVLAAVPPAQEEAVRAFIVDHNLIETDLEEAGLDSRAVGETFDRLVASAQAKGRSPWRSVKFHRHYWLVRARGRLEQARAATGSERADRARVARRCLREALPAAALPLFRADLLVLKAIAEQVAGRPRRALRWLAAAQHLSTRLDAPRITFDVYVERARCLRSLGREGQAREEAELALTLARGRGWIARGRDVRREFGLTEKVTSLARGQGTVGLTRDRRRLDALLRVSAATTGALDPDAVADIVLTEIIDILGADRALLLFPENTMSNGPGSVTGPRSVTGPGAGDGPLVLHAGRTARDAAATEPPSTGDSSTADSSTAESSTDLSSYARSIVARVHTEGRPLVVTGTAQGAALGSESAVQHGLRSILAAPVPIEGGAPGVIYVDSQVAKGLFTEDDVDVLVTLAKQVGVALRTAEAARLQTRLATERRQRELAEVLRDVAEQAGSTLRSSDVLRRVLAAARPVLPYDDVWVLDQSAGSAIRVTEVHGDVDPRAVGSSVEHAGDVLGPAFAGAAVGGSPAARPIRLPGVPEPLRNWLALPATALRPVPAVVVLATHHGVTGGVDGSGGLGGAGPAGGPGSEGGAGPQAEVARMVLNTAATAYDNARLYEEARHSAATDPLTGLPNRRHFVEQATVEADARLPADRPTSAAMIDVDRFKQVNDLHGHAVGDEVLVEIARRIERCLRRGDLAGRLGGEEFAVLVTGGPDVAHALGERVRLAVCDRPVQTSAGPLHVTVSVGTATVDPDEPALAAVLAHADQSLYAAKSAGRNRTVTARS
ncbi:diguanylate cyclase (GGDEF) domain-containing protein [Parafrankia irregularis]|uniref:Diguanylate cyclase (GGDEF) domain-containing protein n=1 Tax=Parafrankia irregularis TaxID=795642 RepID=A0A0S4QQ09_9ACTN|nr:MULTISPECIES: diguanylate cyclase [Parafrankia]CUU56876.1 diguanylate cyclase (GGDEF) domain-containing protein [Parafrankia irregularis]